MSCTFGRLLQIQHQLQRNPYRTQKNAIDVWWRHVHQFRDSDLLRPQSLNLTLARCCLFCIYVDHIIRCCFHLQKKTVTKRFACISYELTEIEKCFVHWNRHHWNRGVSNKDKNRTKKYTKLCAKHMEVHISCMFHEPRLQRRCSIGIETPTTSSTLPGRDVHTEK